MYDPLDDLAAELARLQPNETSHRLNRMVEQELGTSAGPHLAETVRPPRWRWVPLALAAALALVVAVTMIWQRRSGPVAEAGAARTAVHPAASNAQPRSPSPFVAAAPFRRVSQTHYLLGAEDEGLIAVPASAPWRKVRWQYLSASEWRDDQGQATYQVLIPREETVLLPVAVY